MISIMNEELFWKKYGVITEKAKPEKFVDPTTVLLVFCFCNDEFWGYNLIKF